MKIALTIWFGLLGCLLPIAAQNDTLQIPKTVPAGAAMSIPTTGSGDAVFYIAGPGQVLKRAVHLGDTISLEEGEIHNAGHYTALLVSGSSTQAGQFDVVAAMLPASVSFLAKPARLPVNLTDGISGVAYLFDSFHNLILQPMPVTFELSGTTGAPQKRTVNSTNGVAWIKINSADKAGNAQFAVTAGPVTAKRVVQQGPGDPCKLTMTAQQDGKQIDLKTEPVRDCRGNAVVDGTIVTFTESYNGAETTVDAPLKRGIAQAKMPAYPGAAISVASGVVLGNEIRWQSK
jgi:hypothetical protein